MSDILKNKYIVWSQENCSFCSMAVKFLESVGAEIEIRKIGDGWTKRELIEAVPNARSVPQVFHGDKYIGGYPELVKYVRT